MKNWRKWALNGILCMMAVMTLADLAGFGRKGGGLDTLAEDSAGITPLKGSTGLIETVGEILAAESAAFYGRGLLLSFLSG